jgi:hypothetical protein
MYHVITALGGAGLQKATLADGANITLYAVFTIFCFTSPACLNYFGMPSALVRWDTPHMLLVSGVTTTPTMKVSCISAERGVVSPLLFCGQRIERGISSYATEDKKGL